jgi:hypothetical protein
MTMVHKNVDGWISPEFFRAYVNAEIKVPNTLIAVGPYVGRAALASLQATDDLEAAVTRFAKTYAFSPSQINSAIKTVVTVHRRFGVPVLPEGADLQGQNGIRVFPHRRFEVVYMEGVMNILESILRLHGVRGTIASPRDALVAELLGIPTSLRRRSQHSRQRRMPSTVRQPSRGRKPSRRSSTSSRQVKSHGPWLRRTRTAFRRTSCPS